MALISMSSPSGSTNSTGALPQQHTRRHARVERVNSYEGDDEYEDYDDFGLGGGKAGGGGGGGKSQKMARRQDNRGGGGAGTIYSAKHIRAKEALQKKAVRR